MANEICARHIPDDHPALNSKIRFENLTIKRKTDYIISFDVNLAFADYARCLLVKRCLSCAKWSLMVRMTATGFTLTIHGGC